MLSALALTGCSGVDNPQTAKISALEADGDIVSSEPADPAASIHITLALKLNNEADLDEFIHQSQTSGSESFGSTLTSAQFVERYAPTADQVSTVTNYLKKNGFTNILVTGNNMLVEADAPAGTVSKVFQTQLARVATKDRRVAHINTARETVPGAISGIVKAVSGLDTASRVHPNWVNASLDAATPSAGAAIAPPAETGLARMADVDTSLIFPSPVRFPIIYSAGNTPNASKTTVGIISIGNVTRSLADLTAFERENGLPTTRYSVIGTQNPDTSSANAIDLQTEISLDSQAIVGMSGGVKELIFYVAPTLAWSDLTAPVSRAVTDNIAKVINISYGGCEAFAPVATLEPFFKRAVAQGQTFVVSSGDSGSTAYSCTGASVEYPASSPNVVAVGGTRLTLNLDGSHYSETAWSGSGGGISSHALGTIPAWQTSVPLLKGKSHRGVPDIAFTSTSSKTIINGSPRHLGGTSLSAPLFAATWARMISGGCASGSGFAAPILYAYAAKNPYISRDIVSGSNGAYSAGPGWDHVTGWGSPIISAMYSTVCTPTSPAPVYGGTINQGATLIPGQEIYSASKHYKLVMQFDGNLVLYNVTKGTAVWNSGTGGNPGAYGSFQTDGNLVVYTPDRQPLWASYTNGAPRAQFVAIQDDGNMVIYESGVPLFSTGTATTSYVDSSSGPAIWNPDVVIRNGQGFTSGNGTNFLVMQADGNLVLYRNGVANWSTGTGGRTGAWAVMQTDGNLVVYSATNTPLWASNTGGHPGLATHVQDNGDVVIAANVARWASNTMGK